MHTTSVSHFAPAHYLGRHRSRITHGHPETTLMTPANTARYRRLEAEDATYAAWRCCRLVTPDALLNVSASAARR